MAKLPPKSQHKSAAKASESASFATLEMALEYARGLEVSTPLRFKQMDDHSHFRVCWEGGYVKSYPSKIAKEGTATDPSTGVVHKYPGSFVSAVRYCTDVDGFLPAEAYVANVLKLSPCIHTAEEWEKILEHHDKFIQNLIFLAVAHENDLLNYPDPGWSVDSPSKGSK